VDPDRFAAGVRAVTEAAEGAARTAVPWRHGLLVWCGLGPDRRAARSLVAPAVEDLYQLPFERFEPYVPYGTPEDVAAALAPYLAAGVSYFLLSSLAADPDGAVHGAAAVRGLLRGDT
jgi:alkanesulfonate monooxygenase SsuD/methylene tetrahydromethanopterin reductase-like flavin-dependent oxidoreductase (luciferase family)